MAETVFSGEASGSEKIDIKNSVDITSDPTMNKVIGLAECLARAVLTGSSTQIGHLTEQICQELNHVHQLPSIQRLLPTENDMKQNSQLYRDIGEPCPVYYTGMHGFLKVIRGRVKVTNFSPVETEGNRRGQSCIRCQLPQTKIVSSTDECCVLSPTHNNIHQLESMQQPASFIDVLVPRYNPPERDCHYYTPTSSDTKFAYLSKIAPPQNYFTVDWRPHTLRRTD